MGQTTPKLPLPVGDLDPHLIHGSLGRPHESSTQNGISIGSAERDQQTDKQTDRQTDHTTASLATVRILCTQCVAMRLTNERYTYR